VRITSARIVRPHQQRWIDKARRVVHGADLTEFAPEQPNNRAQVFAEIEANQPEDGVVAETSTS
jgi:hypothetical protein